MTNKLRVSFHDRELPYLPVALSYQNRTFQAEAMLDSGSTVNVLPYYIGAELGAIWENQNSVLQLAGNLAAIESRALLLNGTISGLPPVRLAFAWAKISEVPLILGHANFFMEFDVCFYRADRAFEISIHQSV
jgi:hypothetical protein